jgi:predicted NBD/HSP70 family sugar kinase
VLHTLTLPIRIDRQPVSVIADLVEDGVRRCIADAGLTMERINGVCVGLPGVVERAAGVCRQSPIFRERDVPFAAALKSRLGIDASVDSDVNLVTLAEHWFGMGRGLDDFIVVSVEQSLGLGVIHNGELFRGANGLSPDLGDLLFRLPVPGANGAFNVGRLSEVASEEAIFGEVSALLNGEIDSGLRGERRIARVVELAEGGDTRVLGVLATAGEALGFAIANLIALFAPPKVILAGAALSAGDRFLSPLRSTVATLTPANLADVSEIVVHQWGADMWARGAAAMTLRDLYGAPWSTTGPAR